ncbi:protein serine/threonine phosphatase 2C [Fomitiporia mediterranea MF3/22]|uniref:protein serine/threonine phosphatase 2C n=1 Tax=Fomitiporia mediterranea (strain MF3/22) TaxID=694068 RepID=UPI0004409730|nr:protein serine/threonine phosphatase 2C [Fomitiporia mediterranea MF3/22]EJD03779.1 protein serine/threonine phosphatase 2C [Fomitiporia mediterranea MF3/22]
MSQSVEYTIKDASADDFGMSYSEGADTMKWPRPYRSYRSHTAFNEMELARIADFAELKSPDGKLVAHTATFQPFQEPKLGAKPSEDRLVFQIWDLPSGSWHFAAVFDGHAGKEIAEYAHLELPARVRRALQPLDITNAEPQLISDTLTKTIEDFDKSIADDLKALLPRDFEKLDDDSLKKLVNDQDAGSKVYDACIRCMRGSTVIIALIDRSRQNLWVANLGDCQATLAEYPIGRPDDFKATSLSSPHNARVDKEVKRVQSEHPGEEGAILNGRVLGALAVTRALSDFTFKLPPVYSTKLFLHANPGYRMSSKVHDFLPRSLTPPYVSATPEVVHRTLKNVTDTGEEIKYSLVLCSDGLTDLYYSRDWTMEGAARQIARICVKSNGEEWPGLKGNLALHLSKDAIGDDLEQQCRNLTVDLDYQHLDDTTTVVLSW